MEPSSRTPEGWPNHCPVCGKDVRIEPSTPPGDAPCPHCGHLLWFDPRCGKDEQPISPATRSRLQQCFEHACKQTAQENYDYASELLLQCIQGDPGNPVYIHDFLGNLRRKYGNSKWGRLPAQFKQRKARNALAKALSQCQWDEVIKNGPAILKVNPWDVSTLVAMAKAYENMAGEQDSPFHSSFAECALFCLKCALEANPKDSEVCKQVGIALEKRKYLDDAIASWKRAERDRPGDKEG